MKKDGHQTGKQEEPVLEIEGLAFRAGASVPPVSVCAALPAGSALVVTGPSGAGKSTLLRTLCRFHKPVAGRVRLRGISWSDYPVLQWRKLVHYLPQKPVVFRGTVWENLTVPFSVSMVRRELNLDPAGAERLLSLLLPHNPPGQDAATLSGGEAARLALARAMLVKPAVLLLDEPAAALDRDTTRTVMHMLACWLKEGDRRGIIMVSHGDDALFLAEQGIPLVGLHIGGQE